ncbi:MAG: N-succinylglutamate 5-semialdehyde dehydrogenase [Myxococcota bacterium]|nr:N-succinylglutamate 5-semialdehyde dehydrogenase [Myxococcota bacterium]
MELRGNYINGSFGGAETADLLLEREDPAVLDAPPALIPEIRADTDRAVEAARASFRAWARRPLEARIAAVRSLCAAMKKRQEDMAQAISLDMGKPLWEARQEVSTAVAKGAVSIDEGLSHTRNFQPRGLDGECLFRPHGVALVLGPFNFPVHLPNGHILPALLAGNTIVFKPSESAPRSAQVYAECCHEAGLPPGVFNLVQGSGTTGEALVRHPGVDAVMFTGSYQVGRAIQLALIDRPGCIAALEMGGKNAVIVMDDADLRLAAAEIFTGAFLTSGQRCSGTSRVIVMEPVRSRLVNGLRNMIESVRIGSPLDETVFMGPLATRRGYENFIARRHMAANEGAIPLCEGGVMTAAADGYYVRPSMHMVMERNPESLYQREELFGPDIAIHGVTSLDEAIQIANDSDYGLALSVFTKRRDVFQEVQISGRAGVINWNRSTVGASARLPFGGVGKSGNHRPAALFASQYCAWPVASMWRPEGDQSLTSYPGMTLPGAL